MNSSKVAEIIIEKGVTHLHHANSVITACQFLRHGALLSRGSIERRNLFQTPQQSDDIDKKFSVWFDVFTDSVDIHERSGRANKYGPVTFVIDVQIITEMYTGGIWVTKQNPTKWEGKTRDSRWFESSKLLAEKFERGTFDQMIVFRHCGGELPFTEYLKEIIVDDPKLAYGPTDIDYFSQAHGALRLAMTEGRINVPIRKRECKPECRCTRNYRRNSINTRSLYVPEI